MQTKSNLAVNNSQPKWEERYSCRVKRQAWLRMKKRIGLRKRKLPGAGVCFKGAPKTLPGGRKFESRNKKRNVSKGLAQL